MALLFTEGFEAGDATLKGWSLAPTYSSTTPYGVGYSAFASNSTTSILYRNITASAKVFVGFALRTSNNDTSNGVNNPQVIFRSDAAATTHIVVVFRSDAIQVMRGAANGTLLSSYSYSLTNGVFRYFEVSCSISDTVGECIVRMNGNVIINFTGDTKNAGTNTTIDNIGLRLSWYGTYMDDVYIANDTGSAPHNTFLGDIRIHTLVPNAAGSLTQMTPSSGANYTTVDELPYSATDYVRGSAGQSDLYATADLPAGVGTIYGVQATAIVKKSDAGSLSGRTVIKSGTTTAYGTTAALSASDEAFTDIHALNPDTSTSWNSSSVNAVEIGIGAV